MQYQALYRKHRPQLFSEVVGQSHITETLTREVLEGKIAHAYLFAGPRGTGKTTTARILAKALNCPNRDDGGQPCNQCTSCRAVTEGSSLDVIELDAASHNKVEDIREIRVNVGTVASAGGARRVYILDEAHMLSRAAGNALLKTLEEPPEHVIFVLATTEPYKLLDTIRSRSQRFDFHPIPIETLTDLLADISGKEGFAPGPGALAAISDHARGSVRDALSLLEQVAALGSGEVTTDAVRRAMGLADKEAFGRLADAVADADAPAALSLVAALAAQGADLRRFVADAVGFFRGVFLAQYAPNLEEIVDEGLETVEEWRRHASKLSSADVLRGVDLLADALTQLREGREERLVVELALLRLTRPETSTDAASLAARLDRLEDRVRRGIAAGTPAPGAQQEPVAPATPAAAPMPAASPKPAAPPAQEPAASADAPAQEPAAAPATQPEEASGDQTPFASSIAEEEPPAVPEAPAAPPAAPVEDLTLERVEAIWPALAAKVRDDAGPRRNAWFRETRPLAVEGDTMVLGVPEHLKFHLEHLQEDAVFRRMVEQLATELIGGAVRVQYRAMNGETDSGAETTEEGTVPKLHELFEAGPGGIDPEELVKDVLGGEVVE